VFQNDTRFLLFVARKKRRTEILSQLLALIPRLDIKEQGKIYGSSGNRHDGKTETRRHRRLEWKTEVTIRSANESLPGRTLDISESGMSALLPTELEVGEIVELNMKTPIALATGPRCGAKPQCLSSWV